MFRYPEGGQAVVAGKLKTGGQEKEAGEVPKMINTPHEKRYGWLKNGKPFGGFLESRRVVGQEPARNSCDARR